MMMASAEFYISEWVKDEALRDMIRDLRKRSVIYRLIDQWLKKRKLRMN